MDLSALGIKNKQHRVIALTDQSILKDFIAGKIQVIGVECNTRGAYGSPIQQNLARMYPAMMPTVTVADEQKLGTTELWFVKQRGVQVRRQFVANMYLSKGFGLGRSYRNRSDKPVNRYSPRTLGKAFDSMIEQCKQNNVQLDKTIGIQRIYGGLGGVSWDEVLVVLDALCEKHEISIYVYLPKNYDTAYVRGQK